MTIHVNAVLAKFEEQYWAWSSTKEQTREVSCKLEDIDFKIILNKGRWIYPLENCPTPAVIENTVNISSEDPRIKNLFVGFLIQSNKDRDLYHFSKDEESRQLFQLRFFSNELLIKNQLLDEEKKYAPLEEPRWQLKNECILI